MKRLKRSAARFFLALGISAASVIIGEVHSASAAGTAAGTTISNTSAASYQDSSGNSYSGNSNTVSIIVQNAPSMTWATVTPTQIVAPDQTVTDTYTITNTGNAAGFPTITTTPTITGSNVSSYTYSTAAANGGTSYSGNSLANLNTALSTNQIPIGSSIQVSIVYVLSASATVSQTVVTDLTGDITYPATTSPAVPVQSSTATSATSETDTVYQDALLNLQLTVTQNATTIGYSLAAANGSATWAAKDSAAVQTLLGSTAQGVFITMKVPTFNAVPLALTTAVAMAPGTIANGYSNVTPTYAYYYTTSTTGAGPWIAQSGLDPSATYVGVLISGGSCKNGGASTAAGYEVCPPTSAVSTYGSVPNPAYTMTFATAQPSGTGSGTSGAISGIIGNSLIDNNATAPILVGPQIPSTTTDSGASVSALATSGYGIANTTPGSSTINGASNTQASQATATFTVSHGPVGQPLATGSYDGLSNDYTHNFTAKSFLHTGDTYTTTNTTPSYAPTTGSITSAVSSVAVENTIQNTGNNNDTYTILATAPTSHAGWTVYLQPDSGGLTGTTGPSGTTLNGSAAGATSTATSVAISSGASLNYWTVYSAPAGVPYLSESLATIKATSVGSSTMSATTANLLYSGFVALTTSFTVGSTGCPAGVTPAANTACPGGQINYVIDYRNIVGLGNNTTTVSSVPAVSFAGVMTKAGTSFTITSDGTNGTSLGNTWAYATIGGVPTAVTNGPTAAPVDTLNGSNTTFAYYTGSSGGTGPTATWQTGVSKFVATVGNSTFQLVPYGNAAGVNSQGTITFSVVLR